MINCPVCKIKQSEANMVCFWCGAKMGDNAEQQDLV